MTTTWASYNAAMPEKLRPIYDYLQHELDWFLNDAASRNALVSIDMTLHRGNVWRVMRDIFANRVRTWNINNRTWHSYILFENLRRILKSSQDSRSIWNILLNHDMKVNEEFWNECHNRKLYPTFFTVRNLIQSGKCPELPYHASFNLDYSISERQFFTMDSNGHCRIKISKTQWISYDIIIPVSIDHRFTGRVAKPRFVQRTSDGQYVGIISYEIACDTPKFVKGNVLGVDIGKVKPFSATVLHADGTYSHEYIASRLLERNNLSMKKLCTERNRLHDKIERCRSLGTDNPYRNRNYAEIRNKISRLNHDMSLLIAHDIVHIAIINRCQCIDMEKLSWLGSKGGKWNHHDIVQSVRILAQRHGIKTELVNAAYTSSTNPGTHEKGKAIGRMIVFSDGQRIDRDALASINIALQAKPCRVNLRKRSPTPCKVKVPSRRKQRLHELYQKLHVHRNTEIVVSRPCKPKGTWVVTNVIASTSTSLLPRGWKRRVIDYPLLHG